MRIEQRLEIWTHFINAQQATLDQIQGWPHFQGLVGAADAVYRWPMSVAPHPDAPAIFARILLICHKSLLSAATLIARGQPEDSTGITRRALEAARVALAIKINDANTEQWTAYQLRHDRWLKRQSNERPRPFVVRFADVQGDALIEKIDTHLGILSDASVHFTPEFYSSLDWEVRTSPDGNGEVFLNYFRKSQREIEFQFIQLSAAHLAILEALNRCYDGRFMQDDDCRARLAGLFERGRALNEAYHRDNGTAQPE